MSTGLSSTNNREIWLHGNRRAMLSAVIPLALLVAIGLGLLWGFANSAPVVVWWISAVLVGIGGQLLILLVSIGMRPRLVRSGEHLLMFLRTSGPIEVPLEYVECFFLEKSLTPLPGKSHREVEAYNLSVRIAERATDWQTVETNRTFGKWCGGYITIRGMWCERLSLDLVNRLNAQLVEAQKHAARPVVSSS
ncbi:MAG: hypothetical protein SGJ20_05265 [Planctomycetota bacterium]|nr:hypothetical protein [Planctomycetota bacterium]